jgi:hypothetical protein
MKRLWTTRQLTGFIVAATVVAVVAVRALTSEPAGSDIVLPDSPLYNIAVTESIKGLNGQKDDPAAQIKPCPKCGKFHAKPGAQSNIAGSAGGVSTRYQYCPNCGVYHPVVQPVQVDPPGVTPLP